MGPRCIAPPGKSAWCRAGWHIEAEARLGRLLLDEEEPPAALVQIDITQLEAGEDHVGGELALKHRQFDIAGCRWVDQLLTGGIGPPGQHDSVWIAPHQLTAHQQNQLPTL